MLTRYHQNQLAQVTQMAHQLKHVRVLALELVKRTRLPLSTIGLLLRTMLATHGFRTSAMEIRPTTLRAVVTTSELFGESLRKQRQSIKQDKIMYIQLTNIDADTGILCTKAPMRTGPAIPNVKGFQFIFQNESDFPIASNADGSFSKSPLIWGTCHDDADTTLVGVLKVLSQVEFDTDKQAEHQARKPYPSWIGNINTMSWQPPLPYPQDDKQYYWDESIINWVEVINA